MRRTTFIDRLFESYRGAVKFIDYELPSRCDGYDEKTLEINLRYSQVLGAWCLEVKGVRKWEHLKTGIEPAEKVSIYII